MRLYMRFYKITSDYMRLHEITWITKITTDYTDCIDRVHGIT